MFILLPKNAVPPYQTVVWFPGSYVFGPFPSTGDLGMTPYFDFLPRTGRAPDEVDGDMGAAVAGGGNAPENQDAQQHAAEVVVIRD